jgi:hypothetical protein
VRRTGTDRTPGSLHGEPTVKKLAKPYQTPRLTVHGDVREITQSHGQYGGLDGGTKQPDLRTCKNADLTGCKT